MERDRQSSEPKGQTQLTQQAEKWPTASSCVANDGETVETWERRRQENLAKGYNGNGRGTPLTIAAIRWPTAQATDSASAARHTTETGIMHPGTTLTDAIKLWRTPDTPGSGGPRNRQDSMGEGHQITIAEQAEHWSTPNAHDATGARGKGFELTDHHYKPHDLVAQIDNWPSPAARDWKSEESCENRKEFHQPSLSAFVYLNSLPAPAIPDGPTSSETDRTSRRHWQTPKDTGGGNSSRSGDRKDELLLNGEGPAFMKDQSKRLNPRFVEWLMGFPISWTER